MIEGVDFSWGRPSPAALVAAGKRFVVRYAPYAGDGGKGATRAELAGYRAAGLDVVLVFESTRARALAGFAAGVVDAGVVGSALALLGAPADLPCYFGVDWAATAAEQPTIDNYLRGVASVIGLERTGVYGSFAVCTRTRASGTAVWFWQTYAWSAGQVASFAHLYQYLNDQTIGGALVDFTRAQTEAFGQWPASAGTEVGPMTRIPIGGREVAMPTFCNERFDGPPYWACTFSAGRMGANVATLGRRSPPTYAEIAALAKASGDPDVHGGSKTSELVVALKARYGLDAVRQNVGRTELVRRLENGWGLIAGCYYGKLPTHYRRWSPSFTGGHRVFIVGHTANGDQVRFFDPMAIGPTTYTGEFISLDDFYPAFWSDEQVWILEGMDVQTTIAILQTFNPPRRWSVKAGTTVRAYVPTRLNTIARTVVFDEASGANFDRLVEIAQAPDAGSAPHGRFFRCVDGLFAGLYIAAGASGITADFDPPTSEGGITQAELDAAIARARLDEYARVKAGASASAAITFPPAPGGTA